MKTLLIKRLLIFGAFAVFLVLLCLNVPEENKRVTLIASIVVLIGVGIILAKKQFNGGHARYESSRDALDPDAKITKVWHDDAVRAGSIKVTDNETVVTFSDGYEYVTNLNYYRLLLSNRQNTSVDEAIRSDAIKAHDKAVAKQLEKEEKRYKRKVG